MGFVSSYSLPDGPNTKSSSVAGAGKTKLVSNIIDQFFNRPHDEALAYFYCNRNEESRRHPENVLRSFVKQLSISRDEQAVQASLADIYKAKQRTGFASARLTSEEAESLLPKLMQAYTRTTLVLDALDECHEDSRSSLIEAFSRLIQMSLQVRILVSSRRDQDIKLQLEKEANVGIEATDNHDDIRKYVLARIDEDRQRRRIPLSDKLREQIVQSLLDKSQGM
jgi:Cdc6-like AAA superfamily ATPase